MKSTTRNRPWGVVTASVLSWVTGFALIVLAVLSAFSGHGAFSGSVAAMLGVYGLLVIAAGWALWSMRILARGPVVATALLHLAVILSGTLVVPHWGIRVALAVVPALTIVAVFVPSTTRAIHARRTPIDSDNDGSASSSTRT